MEKVNLIVSNVQGTMRISYDARRKMISLKQSLIVYGMQVSQLYIEDFNAVSNCIAVVHMTIIW